MTALTKTIMLDTRGEGDILDFTHDLERIVAESGVRRGIAIAFVPGSTAGITTIEHEPGVVKDLGEAFERIAPRNGRYAHNHGGDANGFAHVRAAVLGPSEAIPIVEGSLELGTWQQVVLIDFDDRPRRRTITVQVVGD